MSSLHAGLRVGLLLGIVSVTHREEEATCTWSGSTTQPFLSCSRVESASVVSRCRECRAGARDGQRNSTEETRTWVLPDDGQHLAIPLPFALDVRAWWASVVIVRRSWSLSLSLSLSLLLSPSLSILPSSYVIRRHCHLPSIAVCHHHCPSSVVQVEPADNRTQRKTGAVWAWCSNLETVPRPVPPVSEIPWVNPHL